MLSLSFLFLSNDANFSCKVNFSSILVVVSAIFSSGFSEVSELNSNKYVMILTAIKNTPAINNFRSLLSLIPGPWIGPGYTTS